VNDSITLHQLLESRENRAYRQKKLIEQYGCTLISFMVNMPGDTKDTPLSRSIFSAGLSVLNDYISSKSLQLIHKESHIMPTGHEGFFLLDILADKLKQDLTGLEDTHYLGRLFDFDVIDSHMHHLSRSDTGAQLRKCLVCSETAAACVRQKRHSVVQILETIQSLYDCFDKKNLQN